MKTIVYALVSYFLTVMFLYLIGGFVLLDWDVTQWSKGDRFSVVYLSVFGPFFFMVFKD